MLYFIKKFRHNFIILCINFIYFLNFFVVNSKLNSPPEIIHITGEYLIHNAGEDLNLSCHGLKNVEWSWESENENFSENQEENYATLIIRNLSYSDTGRFNCIYEDDDEELEREVYVFVKDKKHLFLQNESINLTADQYEDLTIPCRTTSPDIKVDLIRNGLQSPINLISYDPKTGAVVKFNETTDTGQYSCIGTNNFTKEELKINIVHVRERPAKVNRPKLIDTSAAHFVGQHLKLSCSITMKYEHQMLTWSWSLPSKIKQNDSRLTLSEPHDTTQLILTNLSKEDSGNYTCIVEDQYKNKNNRTISVNVKDESYIDLKCQSSLEPTTGDVGNDVTFIVYVDAHPPAKKYEWYFNNNEIIPDSHYNIYLDKNSRIITSRIIISKVNYADDGLYMFRATNNGTSQIINMTLEVRGPPIVSISRGPSNILPDTNEIFTCTVVGNPTPEIRWNFKRKCLHNEKCLTEPLLNKIDKNDISFTYLSDLTFKTNVSGTLICEANNTIGNNSKEKEILITDIPGGDDGFNVWKDIETVSVGDSLVLYCGVSKYNFSGTIEWYLNDNPLELINDDVYKIVKSSTSYSHRKNIEISNITKEYNGNYRCENGLHSNSIQLNVVDPESANITDTNLNNKEIKLKNGIHYTFYCHAIGIPIPTIIWKKDNELLLPDSKRIKVSNNNETVTFNYTLPQDNGKYSCIVSNRLNTIIRSSKLFISSGINKNKISYWIIIVPSVCIIILIISIILLYIKLRDEKKRIAEFENAGLNHFDEGDVECINPDLAIDDQADLLPYYKEWEFKKENLKLGKVLGAGAFGVVVKAEAQGIVDGQDSCTTVAVKMVKKDADIIYVKALVSELKIMVHLGRHVNVVNLLGACTENLVSKRELLVIVEYCRYGNLLYYLHRHRRDFVNQIDPTTGDFNTAIGADVAFRSRGSSNINSPLPSSFSFFNRAVAGLDYRAEPNVATSQGSDGRPTSFHKRSDTVTSRDSCEQPEWRSNYQADYYDHKAPLCSKDLLCWAFQIARGMEYLVSRRVLHGDLAARNVLVAENNIVKICDFGLAKSIYKDSNYVRKKDCPLPVRWMALESIRDQIFSVQSDVWSYGVVLWELFSLGQSPYSELAEHNTFLQKVEDGYRLQMPKFATKKLYQIMQQCWEERAKNRPLFDQLVNDIGMMLENDDRNHFINLNEPYVHMNAVKAKERSDYLAMMSTPDFDKLSSPHHYVNVAHTASNSAASESNTEYLCMRPISLSNKKSDDSINIGKSITNDASSAEITPMLNNTDGTNYDIESDSGLTTPDYKNISMNNFTNPTYQISTETYKNVDFE